MEYITLFLICFSIFCILAVMYRTIQYISMNWGYNTFDVSQQREAFDETCGSISWSEKRKYRRHKLTCLWQRKTEIVVVRKPLIGRSRLSKRNVWKDVSTVRSKKLERMLEKKTSY